MDSVFFKWINLHSGYLNTQIWALKIVTIPGQTWLSVFHVSYLRMEGKTPVSNDLLALREVEQKRKN